MALTSFGLPTPWGTLEVPLFIVILILTFVLFSFVLERTRSVCDDLGLPFEQFDAGGLFNDDPNMDASSTLPDETEVADLNELKKYLANDRIDQVAFSLLKHLAVYSTGRNLNYNEIEFLREQGIQLKSHGYRMQELIRFVIKSDLFLKK